MDSVPVHPCVCGFQCEKYSQMKRHREGCARWQGRPDPLNLMIERRRKTRTERDPDATKFERCSYCHKRPDHHDSTCPDSQAEAVRRERLKKHDIDPVLFEQFLRVLARRYNDRG